MSSINAAAVECDIGQINTPSLLHVVSLITTILEMYQQYSINIL